MAGDERPEAGRETGIGTGQKIAKAEYEALAGFRRALRSFMRFSELAARAEGLTPQQHQLLLAIGGMPGREWATVGELAEALQLNHNAAVQLVDRAEALGLVRRASRLGDRRVVEVRLTEEGERTLERITELNRGELQRIRDDLARALDRVRG